ncbi:FAD-binding domain-containing protein [Aspergillus unguis]
MDMSSHTHTGSGMPDPVYLQKMYWAAVGSVVGAATLANIINYILLYQRLRDRSSTPAKPKSTFFQAYATVTALFREASNARIPLLSIPIQLPGYKRISLRVYFSPLGPLTLILANLFIVLILSFYKLDTEDQWSWEDIGYRTGFVTIAQLPLIFLLSSRRNIISILTNTSYPSLNYYHRWMARTLWLSATVHMLFWFRSWGRYNYIMNQLQDNDFAKRGFAAWCLLTFIVVSSIRPVRRLGYELFVIQHLVLFVGFLIAVWFHANEQGRIWVWVSVGLLVFDRTVRYLWALVLNVSVFNTHKYSGPRLCWKHRASFTPLSGSVTRVSIDNLESKTQWSPGQYMFLTCHAITPLQSHPFTIASITEDRKIEFLIRAEKGGTKQFLQFALRNQNLPGPAPISRCSRDSRVILLDGPYGFIRPLRQFDTVVLIAGGMGATFTVPLLRDILLRWQNDSIREKATVTRRVEFVSVIRSHAHLVWFETQLQAVVANRDARRRAALGIGSAVERDVDVSVYVTGAGDERSGMVLQDRLPDVSSYPIQEPAGQTDAVVYSGDGGAVAMAEKLDDEAQARCNPSSAPASLSPKPGRPPLRKIIRSALENATGESAVVVCGPESLSDDVSRSVVSLSEERAVHKGTGAQGVYLHVERFGW